MKNINLNLKGYDLLGKDGAEGLRYAWKHPSTINYVESAAFTQHSKSLIDDISGYTTSVSSGCILSSFNLACKFCRTGTQLPFGKLLTSVEIAKQNIFMVLSDMYCSDHKNLRTNKREFAYMGQGEPGFSYTQVREAIELTNIVMKVLGQDVHRHIIATSGVPQMIDEYISDLTNNVFSSRTTLHFSLHGTENRSDIMPINTRYKYKECLELLPKIIQISGEKPCIGILLLNNFIPMGSETAYCTDIESVNGILQELDSSEVRLSFCEFNGSSDLGTFETFNMEVSNRILALAQHKGFEAKLFSSFGQKEVSACGMLGGKSPQRTPSEKWIELEKQAEEMVLAATRELKL